MSGVYCYLLADEVGLGKTIEAGAILRQYLLDEPSGRVVVLVPQYLLELLDNLENSLQVKAGDIVEIVRAIRIHISDTYRLHRRMLRNRRASVEDVIFDRNITLKTEYDLDERSPDIHELIEEWRDVAPDDKQYHHIFLLFFRASGTWLGIFKQVIQARLSGETALREGFPPQATALAQAVARDEVTRRVCPLRN
ncbi:hypothetical protein [Nostoc sp.]|uniref:hypothetical protein n=1 Tax=Nostoc sp. TaxID=1180 RepID=UPI002FFD2863